jgi:hypothetical protein
MKCPGDMQGMFSRRTFIKAATAAIITTAISPSLMEKETAKAMVPLALGFDVIESHEGPTSAFIDKIDSWSQRWGGYYPAAALVSCDAQAGWAGDEIPGRNFPRRALTALRERGTIGIVNWTPHRDDNPLDSIINGEHDDYYRSWAQEAADWGSSLIVCFMWEMNGNWFYWSPQASNNTAAKYVKAWKRVHDIVKPIAPNVKFFWCAATSNAFRLEDFFPGDDYVDYTGIDIYKTSSKTGTFYQIADPWITRIRALGTSYMIIGESGVSESFSASERAAFLRDGYRQLAERWGKLKCIVHFNIDASFEGPNRDWRLDAEPSIAYTYKTHLVGSPDFRGRFLVS